jgi:hypothetical protein
MSDQIIINITPDPSINISAVDNNEEIDLNAITLNQGLINHSVTHQSGGSDALAHNLLGGLNGGQSSEYYHLTQNQYDNAVYRYDLPVYQTGTQTISGVKTFIDRPTVNGIGVLLSGEGGGGGSVSGDYLPISGGTISGSLNVTGNTTVSGNIYANSGDFNNLNAAETYFVDSNQALSLQNTIETWDFDAELNNQFLSDVLDVSMADPIDVEFENDGMIFYTLDVDFQIIGYYLNTPWDLYSSYNLSSFEAAFDFSSIGGFAFSADGSHMFVMSSANGASNKIVRYNLATPWDVSSALLSQTKTLSSITGFPSSSLRCLRFSPDGKKIFIIAEAVAFDRIYEISLQTEWDLTSTMAIVGFVNTRNFPFTSQNPRSIRFNNDGSSMFFIDSMPSTALYYQRTVIEVGLPDAFSLDPSNINRKGTSSFIDLQDARTLYYSDEYEKCLVVASSTSKALAAFEISPKITVGYFDVYLSNGNNVIIDKLKLTSESFSLINQGSSQFYGQIEARQGIQIGPQNSTNDGYLLWPNNCKIQSRSSGVLRFSDGVTDATLNRIQLGGTGTASPSIKVNSSGIDIRNAADTAFTALRAADITASGVVGATSFAFSPSGSRITSSQNGIVALTNNSENDFGRLQFGGITTSYPSIVRNGSGIDVRDAANTKFTPLAASNITANGSIYATSGIYATGTIVTNNDIEVSDFAKGVVLKSSDGSRFRITVNNSGALTTTQL